MKGNILSVCNNVCEKLVITLLFALLLINAVSNYFVEIGSGVLVIASYFLIAINLFLCTTKRRVRKISFVLFLLVYGFVTHFIWKGDLKYDTVLGSFNLNVFHLFSYVPLVICALFLFEKSDKLTATYMRIIFILITLAVFIYTTIVLIEDPSAVRMTTAGQLLDMPLLLTYSHTYSMVTMFPFMIVWCLKTKPTKKNWWIFALKVLFIVFTVYVIYLASFLLALIAIVLSVLTFLFCLIKSKRVKIILPIAAVALMAILIATGALSAILKGVISIIPSEIIQEKLTSIVVFLDTGESFGSGVRFEMYLNDFLTFLKHPILGNIIHDNSFVLSRHSTILDVLSGYGIFTFILYVLFHVNVLKANLKRKSKFDRYASIASFVTFMFIATVNPVMSSPTVTVFFIIGSIIFIGLPEKEEYALLGGKVDFAPLKIVEINMFVNGSTGKIMLNVAKRARECGHIVKTYSTHVFSVKYKKLPKAPDGHEYYGNYLDNALHFILVHFFGKNGTHSIYSTWNLLRDIKIFNPDVLHLHNLHGCCINLPMLFRYIKKRKVKVIWTLHDCWAFTGHCAYYDLKKCEKWKTGCVDCSSHLDYPKSKKDTSVWQYAHKKEWFNGVENMTIVTPSKWLANQVEKSFLSNYPVRVINNGIDLDVFKPTDSDLREKYELTDKKVLLFVADAWGARKGFDDVVKLSSMLSNEYKMVMIGLSDQQKADIPENILGLLRTESVEELVKWYSLADVFVNTTMEENFPTVNMEALACGTPVITYKTGGSAEIIDATCGVAVTKGDIDSLLKEIIRVCNEAPFTADACVDRAKQFNMNDRFDEYVELYQKVTSK